MIHLILGGVRSGKSSYAESLVRKQAVNGKQAVYIATSTVLDDEMQQRVSRHQQDRKTDELNWITIESPLNLTQTLLDQGSKNTVILVDCLTLWLTNHLMRDDFDTSWQKTKQDLLDALSELTGEVYFVSNEVGCGVIPMGKLTRRFVDEAGWLHQDIAKIAENVTFVTAGLPMILKGELKQ